jgi:hypothetical protein
MNGQTVGERVALAIELWSHYLHRSGERLTSQILVKAWLTGLKAAGIKADNVKVWERGRKYPTVMPFVIEFSCPHDHRSADRRSLASVRLLIEDDGWASLDEDSPCPECTLAVLETWLLTCPRCEAGEDSPTHRPGHALNHSRRVAADGSVEVYGSTSPLSFLLFEFEHLRSLAEARWWVDHTAEAIEELRRRYQEPGVIFDPAPLAEHMLTRAHRRLDQIAVPALVAITWTPEAAADWLDRQTTAEGKPLVPVRASQRAAWDAVQPLTDRPPKNTIEAAQTLRKSRLAS